MSFLGGENGSIHFTVELGAALRKMSLSQSRGPEHLIELQEMPSYAPIHCSLSIQTPMCRSKGPPLWAEAAQMDRNWTSKWYLYWKQNKTKKLAHPFQVRGSQSTWLKSRAHSKGSQLPPSLISTATELHWPLRPACGFPSSGTKESPGLPPMPLPLQIQWGKDIKLMSRRGVSIFLGLESFPTNREEEREGGREGGRRGLREGLESLPREREQRGVE